jgi:hypothetical protein
MNFGCTPPDINPPWQSHDGESTAKASSSRPLGRQQNALTPSEPTGRQGTVNFLTGLLALLLLVLLLFRLKGAEFRSFVWSHTLL